MPPVTIAHVLLGVSCLVIAAILFVLVRRTTRGDNPYERTALLLIGVFVATGVVHVGALAANTSQSLDWLMMVAGIAGGLAAAALISNLVARRGAMSFRDLQQQVDRSNNALRSLQGEHVELTNTINARTLELSQTKQRFESTLRKAPIFVSNQDCDQNYTWVRNPPPGYDAELMVGSNDSAIFPAAIAVPLQAIKANTLATREHGRLEVVFEAQDMSRWYEIGVDPMVNAAGDVTGITTAAIDVTNRKRNEAQLKLLLRDVTHRAKNVLAVVSAVARQTASRTGTKDEFVDRFLARVQALARAHDLLVNEDWKGVRVSELVRSQIMRFEKFLGTRILCEGPDVTLGPEATQNLGLALHELVHNAGKFGALSNDAGIVSIGWTVEGRGGDSSFALTWKESNGPPVIENDRMGFGRSFIERAVGRSLDGHAKLELLPAGVQCVLEVPGYHLLRYDR